MANSDRNHLIQELQDLYHMEGQILDVLSRMLKETPSRELRSRFKENIQTLKGHMRLLDRAAKIAPITPLGMDHGMLKKILKEGQEHVDRQISLLTKMIIENEFNDSVALIS